MKVRKACWELLVMFLFELSDLVVWSSGVEMEPADGKCGGPAS